MVLPIRTTYLEGQLMCKDTANEVRRITYDADVTVDGYHIVEMHT